MSELYQLPNGWEWKSLSDVVFFQEGPGILKSQMSKDGIPLLNIRTFNKDETLDLTDTNFIPKETIDKKYTHFLVEVDDILVASSGSLGKMAIVRDCDLPALLNTSIIRFRPLDIDKMDRMFLKYFLNSDNFSNQYNNAYTGSAIKNFGPTHLKKMNIILPPLSEQQRIVLKLDKLFEKIDKSIALHQKNMDEADVFMGSVLNDVFGELEEKYGLIKIDDTVLKTKNKNPMDDKDKPFTYIDISSIDNKSFRIVEPKQLIGSEAPSRAKKEVLLGDIVYSTTRPNLKNISIVSKEYDNPIASTGFCVLRVNDKTINSYLFYYLITDKLYEQIEPNIRGAQYPATSDKDLKNCNIPNTPLPIQQKVVKYLDEISQKIEKVKSVQKEKMDSLKALKASILDRAFRGEL